MLQKKKNTNRHKKGCDLKENVFYILIAERTRGIFTHFCCHTYQRAGMLCPGMQDTAQ